MLEKAPRAVGEALGGVRAGYEKIVGEARFGETPMTIVLESAAFEDGGAIPARYTNDGEKLSPPLAWRGAPADAEGLVLIVEDPDAPSAHPLVHLLVWDLPPDLDHLPEGELESPGHQGLDELLGRNSFLGVSYLPPDPPTGHGVHRYVFQIFALKQRLNYDSAPTCETMVKDMEGLVIAQGRTVGTYERPGG